jgi:hypothetical protein
MDGQWGGKREGAGRRPADYVPPEYNADDGDEDGGKFTYEGERAKHERVKRQEREFKLAVAQGEYVPRAVNAQASATALAVLTQSLRSVPDTLERVCNLTPEQADLAQQSIDAALLEVAKAFQAMAGETT